MALSQQALKEMKHQRGHGLRNAATFIAPIDGLSHVSGDRSQALLDHLKREGVGATNLYRLHFVTHLDVDAAGVDRAAAAIRAFFSA